VWHHCLTKAQWETLEAIQRRALRSIYPPTIGIYLCAHSFENAVSPQSPQTHKYTVSQKTKQICFCQNFVKFPPISIIFGRKMGNDPNWSDSWQLKLANNKCQHSRIGLSRAVCSADYYVSDIKLRTVQNVRDLGVLYSLTVIWPFVTILIRLFLVDISELCRSGAVFYAKMLVSYVKHL